MNTNNKIFETNHHFHEYEYGDIHDLLSGIINTVNKVIYEYEQKDPNFKNYKYCIINGSGDPNIKIPDFLKTKTEVVEKTKKFLWWTVKKWTEKIEKRNILEIQTPYLMEYETNLNWLERIEEISIVVPLNPSSGIDLTINNDLPENHKDRFFSSYDFTKAYGWVVRNTSLISLESWKLVASILMLNLTDYYYDSKKHKIVISKYKNNTLNIGDWDLESTLSHELMHLYDTYKILMSKKHSIDNKKEKLGKTAIGYLNLDPNDPSVGDKNYVEMINSMAYQYNDTELNAFNNGLYPNILKFLDNTYKNKIVDSSEINVLANEMKKSSAFKYVKYFCETPPEDIFKSLGPNNWQKFINYPAFHFRKGDNDITKLRTIQFFYKKRSVELYRKRTNILAEAVERHNMDIESDKKIHENYGYPAIMNTGSNSSSALNIMGYQYQLLPLNSYYQQETNKPTNWQYLHRGSKVKAYTLGENSELIIGRISKIEKNEAGEIINVYVTKYDPEKDGNITVKVNPNRIAPNNNYVAKTKF